MKISYRRQAICGFLCAAAALNASASTVVTFQVDMSTSGIDTNTQSVAARGSFNGWGAFPLTNNNSAPNPLLFSGTTNIPGNGTVMSYKYTIEPGASYETTASGGGHNRLVTLPTTSGASLILPQVFFNDAAVTPVTIPVTFRVNMAQQINTGSFVPASSMVYARGFFNSWATGGPLTNDPSIHTTNQFGLVSSNVYVYTFDVTGSPGQTTDYKYFIDTGGNWESPAAGTGDPGDNNNRFFNLSAAPPQTLPIVYFNDAPYAPVTTNATTFQVDMTLQIQKGAFDPTVGTVELRGNFNSWGTPQILCTNSSTDPNPNIYRAVVPITDGVGAVEQYKFWASVSQNGGWETMANNRLMTVIAGTTQTLPVVVFDDLDFPRVTARRTNNQVQVSWTYGTLQESTDPGGGYTDLDPSVTSPYTFTPSGSGRTFFRVRDGGLGTTFYDTEMVTLDLSGGSLPSGLIIRESPTLVSPGKTAVQPQPSGDFAIRSTFNIETELSLDNGNTWRPNTNGPHRMTLIGPPMNIFPTNTLPPIGWYYTNEPPGWYAIYPPNIILTNLVHRGWTNSFPLPDPGGVTDTHDFSSVVSGRISINGGQTFNAFTAPAAVEVRVSSRP